MSLVETRHARASAPRAVVDAGGAGATPTYGINTGFGNFAKVRIPHDSLAELQVNLLRSHAAGVGDPLPVPVVRATMALRANVLAKGFSGIRLETLELLLALLNHRVHPVVPSRGSVGASGDLAPLAHLALVLIGEGEAWHDGARAWRRGAGARPVSTPASLAPKEGLALINGTQPSTALLGLALAGALRLARAADIAAALSIDGLQGSTKPFDPRIHEARGLAGQRESADNLLAARRQRHQRRPTPTAAGSRTPIRCGARRRCTARRATRSLSRADVRRRGQCRHRQPDGLRRHARDRLRRQLSRRAGGVAADVLCLGARAAGHDQRAAIRSARQPVEQRAARVPHPPRRPAVGADDGAGDRGRADLGAEDARASGERGHDPDVRQQGRPRQHEHGGALKAARALELARQVSSPSNCCARVRRSICSRRSRLIGAADARA